MNPQLRDLLFDFEGRIDRRQFWQAWLVLIVAGVAFMLSFLLISLLPYLAIVLALIFCVLWSNSSVAIGIMRLHDRGKSGYWLLLFYLGPGVLGAIGKLAGSSIALLLDSASSLIVVWTIVELGCLRGIAGPNKYGPDPLA